MTDNVITFRSHYERAQDAQAAAALPDRSAWVEAHAGSGKTKVLIDRASSFAARMAARVPRPIPSSALPIPRLQPTRC